MKVALKTDGRNFFIKQLIYWKIDHKAILLSDPYAF
jgi:hypothetical protein